MKSNKMQISLSLKGNIGERPWTFLCKSRPPWRSAV